PRARSAQSSSHGKDETLASFPQMNLALKFETLNPADLVAKGRLGRQITNKFDWARSLFIRELDFIQNVRKNRSRERIVEKNRGRVRWDFKRCSIGIDNLDILATQFALALGHILARSLG